MNVLNRKRRLFLSKIICLGLLLTSLASFLGKWNWIFDNLSHFRLHYLVAGLALSAFFAFRLRPVWATVGLLVVAINAPYFWYFWGVQPISGPSSPSFSVQLINVNQWNQDRNSVLDLLRSTRPAFFAIVELDEQWAESLEALHPHYPHRSRLVRSDHNGLGLYSTLPIKDTETVYLSELEVPALTAIIQVGATALRVWVIHPSSPESSERFHHRNQYLNDVSERIQEETLPVIVLADLNVTPASPFYRSFVESARLHDPRRGSGFFPTWPSWFARVGIPLDFVFYRESIQSRIRIRDLRVLKQIGSDHRPLAFSVALGPPNS